MVSRLGAFLKVHPSTIEKPTALRARAVVGAGAERAEPIFILFKICNGGRF